MPRKANSIEQGLSRRNLFRIGAGLAAAGMLLDITGCTPAPAHQETATASAPATPGSTDPTKTDFAPKDRSDIDMSTFPFIVGGKTYEGEAAFKKACEVRVADYPTAKEALPALLAMLNNVTTAGQTPEEFVRYENYFPEGEKHATMPAVVEGIYNEEYLACLGGKKQTTDAPDVLFSNVLPTATDNAVAWISSHKSGDKVPYTASYTADVSNAEFSNKSSGEFSEFSNVGLNYEDNGDQNSIGEKRTSKHWLGIGTAKDYYKTVISGDVSVEDGHWVMFVKAQRYLETSRPTE